MITIKNTEQFEKMAYAGATVAMVHRAVRDAATPGVTTLELDQIAADVIAGRGCQPSFLNYRGTYPAHICASPNDVIVHGIPDGYRLRDGDILAVDAGAIFEGFHGDAATTFAIGDVPDEVTALLEVTERALWAAIEITSHGTRVGDIGATVSEVAAEHGYGVVKEYVGHGIGREMHEEPQIPNYGQRGKGYKLKKGMAICIEPMFNLGTGDTKLDSDGWTVRTADGSLSAHFEHTIAITKEGPRVLTLAEDLVKGAEAG